MSNRFYLAFQAIILFSVVKTYSQQEKVHLDLDKYTCRAGDTVWFKGYIFRGLRPSSLSTNLYVEVFTDRGVLLSRDVFPVFRGLSIGQLIFNDSIPTDNYYVVAFTKQQLNYDTTGFFSVPVVVYNKDKPATVFHKRKTLSPMAVSAGMVKGITWITSPYKGQLASMLAVDLGSASRKLHLVKPVQEDTSLTAEVTLNGHSHQQYVLLPVDTTKDVETLLLFEDSVLIGRQDLHLKPLSENVTIDPDTLDISPNGYNSWNIKMPGSSIYYSSISVTDADRSIPSPLTIDHLRDSYTEDLTLPVKLVDTSYITYHGHATRTFGKRIKDQLSKDLLLAGVQDTTFLFTKVIHIDSAGNFMLDSLFFFDNMDLQFQINKPEDGKTKDVKLVLAKYIPPPVNAALFQSDWMDDTQPISKEDTLYTKQELTLSNLSKIKTLKTVVVKSSKDIRKELDHTYTTGAFSEPALYSFDVRTERRYNDMGSYLRANFSRFQGGFSSSDTPKDAMGHPFLFFVDEQNYTWPELQMFDWERIAYIKCFENDFIGDDDFIKFKNNMAHGFTLESAGSGPLKLPVAKTPMIIAIYTRKGKDFRTMPGGLNKIPVKGYSPIIPFTSNRVTLSWNPWESGNTFRVRFNNNETARRFRIKVEGVTPTGKIVHYETIVE